MFERSTWGADRHAWFVYTAAEPGTVRFSRYVLADGVPPGLPHDRHIVVDYDRSSHQSLGNATVLFVRPGVLRYQGSPRHALVERARMLFADFPDAQVIAAVLDDRRCWTQLRGTAPMVLTLDEPGLDPRLLASLVYARRIVQKGWGLPDLNGLRDHEMLLFDEREASARLSLPEPEIDHRLDLDLHAPRLRGPDAVTGTKPITWTQARTRARQLHAAWTPTPENSDVPELWALMVYATAVETDLHVDDVDLPRLRYRLGEATWAEDEPLASARCLRWLAAELRSAGHNVEVSDEPASPLTARDAALIAAADHHRQAQYREDPRRDDPVVTAWNHITNWTAEIESAGGGSDGLTWPARQYATRPYGRQWWRMLRRVDNALLADQGGHGVGATIRTTDAVAAHRCALTPVDIRCDVTIVQPRWTFDHATRSIAHGPPPAYIIDYVHQGRVGSRCAESAPISADHLAARGDR